MIQGMKDEFEAQLKEADATGENAVFRLVYRTLNTAFHEGKFAEVNEIFATLDPALYEASAGIAMLCYSAVCKDKLPARAVFRAAAIANCERRLGKERAQRLAASLS